jgi:redox-sensitive bicupin YhaK (pirin superfamily)
LIFLPDTTALVVLAGQIMVAGSRSADEAEMVLLSREGSGVITIDVKAGAPRNV